MRGLGVFSAFAKLLAPTGQTRLHALLQERPRRVCYLFHDITVVSVLDGFDWFPRKTDSGRSNTWFDWFEGRNAGRQLEVGPTRGLIGSRVVKRSTLIHILNFL